VPIRVSGTEEWGTTPNTYGRDVLMGRRPDAGWGGVGVEAERVGGWHTHCKEPGDDRNGPCAGHALDRRNQASRERVATRVGRGVGSSYRWVGPPVRSPLTIFP